MKKKKRNKPYKTLQVKTTANRYITLYPLHPHFVGYRINGYGPIDTKKHSYNWIMPHLLEKIWFDADLANEFDKHWYKIKGRYNENNT